MDTAASTTPRSALRVSDAYSKALPSCWHAARTTCCCHGKGYGDDTSVTLPMDVLVIGLMVIYEVVLQICRNGTTVTVTHLAMGLQPAARVLKRPAAVAYGG